ncbi:MAG: hypothetical protein Q9173_003309 [Seirophora scorigena]
MAICEQALSSLQIFVLLLGLFFLLVAIRLSVPKSQEVATNTPWQRSRPRSTSIARATCVFSPAAPEAPAPVSSPGACPDLAELADAIEIPELYGITEPKDESPRTSFSNLAEPAQATELVPGLHELPEPPKEAKRKTPPSVRIQKKKQNRPLAPNNNFHNNDESVRSTASIDQHLMQAEIRRNFALLQLKEAEMRSLALKMERMVSDVEELRSGTHRMSRDLKHKDAQVRLLTVGMQRMRSDIAVRGLATSMGELEVPPSDVSSTSVTVLALSKARLLYEVLLAAPFPH